MQSFFRWLKSLFLDPIPDSRSTMTRSELVAYGQGYQAADASGNPYPESSTLHAAWQKGFEAYVSDEMGI